MIHGPGPLHSQPNSSQSISTVLAANRTPAMKLSVKYCGAGVKISWRGLAGPVTKSSGNRLDVFSTSHQQIDVADRHLNTLQHRCGSSN